MASLILFSKDHLIIKSSGNFQVECNFLFTVLYFWIILYMICNFGSVKYQAKPSIIYTSTKSEERLLAALERNGMLLNEVIVQ